MNIASVAVCLGACVLCSAPLFGAPLFVENHSFENPATGNGTFIASDSAAPTGWDIFGPIGSGTRFFGVLNPADTTLYSEPAPDDSNVGVVFLFNPGVGAGGLQQVLGDTLQLNTAYTLTVEVGNIANDPTPPHNSFNFSGFPGYRIELLAGGIVVASEENEVSVAEGNFETATFTFSTGGSHPNASQALGIRLLNLNGSGIEVNFDNVRLDATAVPEPSTWAALLGMAALAVAARRRGLRVPS